MRRFFKKRKKQVAKKKGILIPAELVERCKNTFAENIISMILYGDFLENENVSANGNSTLLVAFKKVDMETVSKANGLFSSLRDFKNLSLLIVEECELFEVASCFPVDFLAAKTNHTVMYGKDLLNDLAVSAENLALKIKGEIMKLYLRARHNLVFLIDKPDVLTRVICLDFPHFISSLRALLLLKQKSFSNEEAAVIESAAEEFSIDAGFLQQIKNIREGASKEKYSDLPLLFHNYVRELFFAYKAADAMIIKTSNETPEYEKGERDLIEE